MARALAGASIALALLVFTSQAAAFGTVDFVPPLGQQDEHERITRSALACPPETPKARGCLDTRTTQELAGENLDFGMVGAPDMQPADIPAAHCDDADHLTRPPGYKPTRDKATEALLRCVNWMRTLSVSALIHAAALLHPDRDVISPAQVDLGNVRCADRDGLASSSYEQDPRAKCRVLLALGRALHTVQDFYSHSNWTDAAAPGPENHRNPPGLKRFDLPPFLEPFASTTAIDVPPKLTTGCYEFDTDDETDEHAESDSHCYARVRHYYMAKDRGTIEPNYGPNALPNAHSPLDPRGKVQRGPVTNFAFAVWGAVNDSRRQWRRLSEALVKVFGPVRGNLMVCALERDDPVNQCQGRDIAIVIDSSGSNTTTDPNDRRIAAGREFNERLISAADANAPGGKPDRSAVIDFDSSARVVSPLGDPSKAKFDGIDSNGGTNIGSGVNLAIDELTKNSNGVLDRAGIVVLTDGQDSSASVLVKALERAKSLGIRVQFGFLSPPSSPVRRRAEARLQPAQSGQPQSVRSAILDTGGVFSTINSAEAQRAFLELVERTGVTNLNDPNGVDDDGGLSPDLTVTARLADPNDIDRFTYDAPAGRRVKATLRPLDGQSLTLRGSSVEELRKLGPAAQGSGPLLVEGSTRRAGTLAFEVNGQQGATGMYEIALTQEGLDVTGTERRDFVLVCSDGLDQAIFEAPKYVLGLGGNDHIICGPGPDVIVPGKGADTVLSGPGDDTIVVGAKDVPKRRTEKIDGNEGIDTVEVAVRRPKRKLRRHKGAIVVPVRKGVLRIRNVERIEFSG